MLSPPPLAISIKTSLTDKVTSTPFEILCTDWNLKPNISLGHQERLNTNGTISVNHMTDYTFRVKFTEHTFVCVEARTGYINDCTT